MEVIEKLMNWYWNFGVKRGQDTNDPDHAVHILSVGDWLDPLVTTLERCQNIQDSAKEKGCVALWGPSQTGKSSLLGHYIDGEQIDGSDSALTWEQDIKVRFSPPFKESSDINKTTIIFNPYQGGLDASGLVSRYTLKHMKDVNTSYPIEVKLADRRHLIQCLSLGYDVECRKSKSSQIWTTENFRKVFSSDTTNNSITREAYIILKEIVDALEVLKGDRRFNSLFQDEEEWKETRSLLLSSPKLLASPQDAEAFMAQIFWDGNDKMTDKYRELKKKLDKIGQEWGSIRIYCSMEAGKLLLNIATTQVMSNNNNKEQKIEQEQQNEKSRILQLQDMIQRFTFEKENGEVHIRLADSSACPNELIGGEDFAVFQALCAELVIPLNRENLEKNENLKKKKNENENVFVEFLEQYDILDFPGVRNGGTGNMVFVNKEGLVDLATCSTYEFFSRVFKQGKTQCFINSYICRYGIDAFLILLRSKRPPSNANMLNVGVEGWIRSLKPDWSMEENPGLPLFVNITFFSDFLNDVDTNIVKTGSNSPTPFNLSSLYESFSDLLFFAKVGDRRFARFLPTTYLQYGNQGKIESSSDKEAVVSAIINDESFCRMTGISKEELNAVYEEDGGLDNLLKTVKGSIDSSLRNRLCEELKKEGEEKIRTMIRAKLPTNAVHDTTQIQNNIKTRLKKTHDFLDDLVKKAEERHDTDAYRQYAQKIKSLLEISPDIFDPLPYTNVPGVCLSENQINDYLKKQADNWFTNKYEYFNTHPDEKLWPEHLNEEKWPDEQTQTQFLLTVLRDNFKSVIHQFAPSQGKDNSQNMFWRLKDLSEAQSARLPFTMMFENVLMTGDIHLKSEVTIGESAPKSLDDYIEAEISRLCNKEKSPYYTTVIKPFIDRLKQISESPCVFVGRRPQPGDKELDEFLNKTLEMFKR